MKRRITERFKEQFEFGVPSSQAEAALRRLAGQLRARKVFLKAFLGYPLHAKLYLVRRHDAACRGPFPPAATMDGTDLSGGPAVICQGDHEHVTESGSVETGGFA